MAGNKPTNRGFDLMGMVRGDSRRLRVNAFKFIKETLRTLSKGLDPFAQAFFAINVPSSMLRSFFVFGPFTLTWILVAHIVQPANYNIDLSTVMPGDVSPSATMIRFLYWIGASIYASLVPLFNPNVFRFVLVIAFAFWLAYRLAAVYLADIFELQNEAVAMKFIRQAAFYTFNRRKFNRLVIREGNVGPMFRDSPIYQIGGPGLVTVNLENVAIFEKVNGEPHIIPPTRRPVPIEGFERLRKIIDLRDQFVENQEVPGRTKDGIPVRAKGVRFSFSVQRDTRLDREPDPMDEYRLPQPLTFTDEAVLNLVYKKSNSDFDQVATNDIKAEIRNFIGRNTLNQFLADSRQEGDSEKGQPTDPTLPLNVGEEGFQAREKINQELIQRFRTMGHPTIDLHWVSVGTWLLPPVIPEKHLEAWEEVTRSQMTSNPKALTKLFRMVRLKELLRLIQDVPINAFGHVASRRETPDVIKKELILAYREKLQGAAEAYRKDGRPVPVTLEAALNHLSKF